MKTVLVSLILIVVFLCCDYFIHNDSPKKDYSKKLLYPFLYKEISELLEPHVLSENLSNLEEKIKHISFDGKEKLQVIFDFDRTLSKYHSNGEITKSSFGLFASIPGVPKSYVEGSQKLYFKYGVIEENPKMTIEEKLPYMDEWWTHYEQLVTHLPLDYDNINKAVIQNNISIRDGADIAFSRLHESQVPVLIFSAGLGDVINSVIQQHKLNFDNVKLISNFFSFKDGHINGFKGKFMHVFNKNQHAIENTEYFKKISNRTNVILLGDSLGDAFMADGVPNSGSVLKIGFLNSNVDESLASFLQHFDLVLLDDQTLNIFNAILSFVLK